MGSDEKVGGMSAEQMQRLSRILSDAKELLRLQEESVDRLMQAEEKLGQTRNSYLQTYNSAYSELLDNVSSNSSYLRTDIESMSKQLTAVSKATATKKSSPEKAPNNVVSSNKSSNNTTAQKTAIIDYTSQLNTIIGLLSTKLKTNVSQAESNLSRYGSNATQNPNIAHGGGRGNGGGGNDGDGPSGNDYAATAEQPKVNNVAQTAEADTRSRLTPIDIIDLSTLKNSVKEKQSKLAQAKDQSSQTDKDNIIEARLTKLSGILDTEIKNQNAANSLRIKEADAKDLGKLTARQTNAEVDAAAYAEMEKRMQEEIADLNLKSRLEHNGILAKDEAARNEENVRKKYASSRQSLLSELRLEQAEQEKLNKFKVVNPQMATMLEQKKADLAAKLELDARLKNNGKYTAEQSKADKKRITETYKLTEGLEQQLGKHRLRDLEKEQKAKKKADKSKVTSAISGPINEDYTLVERFKDLKLATGDKVTQIDSDADGQGRNVANLVAALDTAATMISDLAKKLESKIDEIAKYKGEVDTRLQGSNNKTSSGSYWSQLNKDMMSVGAFTPFFKQEDFANNIRTLVGKGIAFDLKQRAFLMTIQEKIANTFNVADGTLLRLIRIQQEDSTAGRLGMESALNSFLNNMYETSEYLTDVAAQVRGSLEEMESLMSGAAATEVEYQVQKWMGSLYSVGMSQSAVTAISNALGQIASGQVEGLTGGGAGNLIIMAANSVGMSIADVLAEGLDAKNTNKLLQATVNYLAEIAESSKDNNVVQQQLANVFGVKASDLRAATNLASDGTTTSIFGEAKTYNNMLKQLNSMAATLGDRTSQGEKMTNVWNNAQYSIASSIANNPTAYLIYKLAGLLDSAVGGIDLPFINVMGFGVDLNTTVADLMRVAAVSGGILDSLGSMVSGLASSFNGQAMLSTMGISPGSGLTVTPRGKGVGATNSGGGSASTSGSGYVGNSSGSDVKDSTIQESEDSKKKQMIEAKEEEPENQVDVLNATVIKIYELLDDVAKGNQTLRVRIDGYGLTSTGAQGNSSSLLNSSTSNKLTSESGRNTSTSGHSSSMSVVDLGGWTML